MRIFGVQISFKRERRWATLNDVRELSGQVETLRTEVHSLFLSNEAMRKKISRDGKKEEVLDEAQAVLGVAGDNNAPGAEVARKFYPGQELTEEQMSLLGR